ncbi:MAG: hypothetical protein EZS28_043744 [Streblomastix strix]|uniref:Uncharacterized protein n=1 Tax=Streblomastix strix TaxID=222440 RepID=A0A5J4TS69_9EUKA|nr:MAG: hypothetical protein EZS28_043744 [Streblomastix strix]
MFIQKGIIEALSTGGGSCEERLNIRFCALQGIGRLFRNRFIIRARIKSCTLKKLKMIEEEMEAGGVLEDICANNFGDEHLKKESQNNYFIDYW